VWWCIPVVQATLKEREDQGSTLAWTKVSVLVPACGPSYLVVEAGGSEASLDKSTTLYLKNKLKQKAYGCGWSGWALMALCPIPSTTTNHIYTHKNSGIGLWSPWATGFMAETLKREHITLFSPMIGYRSVQDHWRKTSI
jgi:hypothetical protein